MLQDYIGIPDVYCNCRDTWAAARNIGGDDKNSGTQEQIEVKVSPAGTGFIGMRKCDFPSPLCLQPHL